MARAALLMAAAGPALWLIYSVSLEYNAAVMLICLSLALEGGTTFTFVLPRNVPVRARTTTGEEPVVRTRG